jgi:hypothetical protein
MEQVNSDINLVVAANWKTIFSLLSIFRCGGGSAEKDRFFNELLFVVLLFGLYEGRWLLGLRLLECLSFAKA